MPPLLASWLLALGANLLLFSVIWAWATWRRDVSVVDAWWSIGFLVVAVVAVAHGGEVDLRKALVLGCAGLWALRLSLYLARRNHGAAEDRRYAAMRKRSAPSFGARSLVTVFWLQALLATSIALPLALVLARPPLGPLGLLDFAGFLLFAIGFAFEAIGDAQLARFRADPANRGAVLARGVWRYTRHPNYFGEACLWWGLGTVALAASQGWLGLASVVLLTALLLRVSGVSLLERDIADRRPAYREYVARTSAFLPWPPKSPV